MFSVLSLCSEIFSILNNISSLYDMHNQRGISSLYYLSKLYDFEASNMNSFYDLHNIYGWNKPLWPFSSVICMVFMT